MSAISYKIFGNDMAMDVEYDFRTLYGIGKTIDEIQNYIFAYCPEDDEEDACAFWTGLALIEWEYGVLTDEVKNKTQFIIRNNSDKDLFLREKDSIAREKELEQLYSKLNTVNPKPRKRTKTFVYRTNWKSGDILALPLCGKYVYLHVCAIERKPQKIEELEKDDVYVKVFDIATDELLDARFFKHKIFHKLKYKNIDTYRPTFVRRLWCVGVREKNALENKLINIGNVHTKKETTGWIYADFQFSQLENTLKNLFGMQDNL